MKKWIIVFIFFSINAFANFSAKVIKVIDGDTVEVLTTKNNKIKVRLIDIDAPEHGQPYSHKSKQYLASLIDQKQVLIIDKGKDIYKRTLAIILYHQMNINQEMVKSGYAWAYRFKNNATNQKFLKIEAKARQKKLGLWQDKQPIEPWVYKQSHKK